MKKNPDSVYVWVRYITFILASVTSGIINLILFLNLGSLPFEKALFAVMSITLEMSKILVVIAATTFSGINKKIKSKKVKFSMVYYYSLYSLFASLAIFAGVGLSSAITSKSLTDNSSKQNIINFDIDNIQSKINSNENKIKERKNVIETNNIIIDNFNKINKEWEDLEELRAKAERDMKDKLASGLDASLEKNKEEELRNRRNRLTLNTVRRERDYALNENKALQKEIESLDKENLTFIDELTTLRKSSEISKIESTKAQSSVNMFIQLSEMIGIKENSIRFLLLVFISIMLEVIIFSSSPDLPITRKLLKYFKKSFPSEMDTNEIIKIFEKDELKYLEDVKLEKEEIIPKKRGPKKGSKRKPKENIENEEKKQSEDISNKNNMEKLIEKELSSEIKEKELPSETKEKEEKIKVRQIISKENIAPNTDLLDKIPVRKISIRRDIDEIVSCKFGKIMRSTKDTLEKFIDALYDDSTYSKSKELYHLNSLYYAMNKLKISEEQKDLFFNRLSELEKLGNKLIFRDDRNNSIYSKFSKDSIKDYIFN